MQHRLNPSARAHRYLDAAEHAKCLALLATAGNGKTPIMLLNELATRRQLDIAYTTSSPDESQVGAQKPLNPSECLNINCAISSPDHIQIPRKRALRKQSCCFTFASAALV